MHCPVVSYRAPQRAKHMHGETAMRRPVPHHARRCRAVPTAMLLIGMSLFPARATAGGSTTIHVPADQPTIQAAINASTNGDVVEIADGTYTGTGNKNIVFGGKRIEVRSASNDPSVCIIDCETNGRGFDFAAGDDGVTLRGIRVLNCGGLSAYPNIAAIRIRDCSPTLILCQAMQSNSGALYMENASPRVRDCELSDTINQVGVFIYNSSPLLVGCTIRNNTGGNCGVEITEFGGGVSRPVFYGCRILGNTGLNPGGVFLIDVTLVKFQNCLIAGNTGNFGGGLSVLFGSTAVVTNCTFTGNNGNSAGCIRVGTADTVTIRNCIFWNNQRGGFFGESAQLSTDGVGATVNIDRSTFMNYAGTFGGMAVSTADPLLVDDNGADNNFGTVDDDVHLGSGSPAIDAGENAAALGFIVDLDGAARFADDAGTMDTGVGTAPIVDHGVFEFGAGMAGGTDCNSNIIDDAADITLGNSTDCNTNSTPDECDLAAGAADCNSNNTIDLCETPDCNTNSTPDDCDLGAGAADCNTNATPDVCELVDCNTNATLDACELDCNTNATPDACDIGGGAADCNTDATPDVCQLAGHDCDTNDTLDACDIGGGAADCDTNGTPDVCALSSGAADCNTNGTIDACQIMGNDCNTDGTPNECQLAGNDCNTNATPDNCDISGGAADCDTNSTPDVCQLAGHDCNSNTTLDACELAGRDCNTNSQLDACDIGGGAADCDTNGTPDACQLAGHDCNTNVTLDACEIAGHDCNTNLALDVCDLAASAAPDCNANGTPDSCEALVDCNTNGTQDTCELGLQSLVGQLAANHASITSLVPNLFLFSDGDTGDEIDDGGNDMYDGGNHLDTNLASRIPYTNGTVTSSASSFGAGSSYFTAKFPGLFVLAVRNMNVQSFAIEGELGADGDGSAQALSGLTLTVGGQTFAVYSKRVFDAGDPTVNHIIIVPGSGTGITQSIATDTDDDHDQIQGLGGITELYYLLVARDDDLPLDQTQVLAIANQFLTIVQNSGSDCNTNGVPDSCDVAAHANLDCNTNGIIDACDTTSTDCNTDHTLDICQPALDCNSNGKPDACDPDFDHDTITDACDRCPGKDDRIDTDLDGVPDCLDGCPNDPHKSTPGACGCGVSDADANSDGLPDCFSVDLCPTDPDKTSPGICGCGIPDTDSDGDGIADCIDNCPNIANANQADADGDGTGDACEIRPPSPQQDFVRFLINLLFGVPTCGMGMSLSLALSIMGLMGFKRQARRWRKR